MNMADGLAPKDAPKRGAEMILDTRGHRCPVPTLRLQKALADLHSGETVLLLADDAMARIDVPHFAADQGHAILSVTQEAETLHITVQKGAVRP